MSTISPALVSALRQVLRPLIKLMLAKGLTFTYLVELLKGIFVEVADNDYKINNKPSTDSHLSLLTGIHRKDIKRLRHNSQANSETVPPNISLGTRLVSIWTSDTRFLDENKQPKPLPRFIKEGGEISFEGLVSSVSKDIRSRVVLDEWLRIGIAHFDEQHCVCLNTSAFIPTQGFDEKACYFGQSLHDHAAAATSNLIGGNKPFLERSVYYDKLTTQSIEQLAARSEMLGMETLVAINKQAMELEAGDAHQNKSKYRMRFGIYFYSEPFEAETEMTVENEKSFT
ncbi:MAG: hypothetical protein IPI97_12605 [Nitrosomonas sp.]|nr:hypothetical protein [Nitrosomonas sp.]MBK7365792.1 hypothetical protein [Nitrosomonas sp.]